MTFSSKFQSVKVKNNDFPLEIKTFTKLKTRNRAQNAKNGENSDFNARSQANHTTYNQTFDVCGKRPLISC